MPIPAQLDPFAEAAAHQARTGPVADLAKGRLPPCFADLRQTLAAQVREAQVTAAEMGMHDDDGEPYWQAGVEEVGEILRSTTALHAWASEQRCTPLACRCRADRVLRRDLAALRVPACSGYRPDRPDRASALMVGNPYPEDGPVRPVQVSHRGSIDHMVQQHRGWRARLRTDEGVVTVYQSPGYPSTPVEDYLEDTSACARAVADALR